VESAEISAQLLADRAAVRAALARLSLRQRECAVCHLQFGMSHTETADALGLRVGTVKTHIERARRALVTALEDTR
jgi:RNA polymerase sigma factor (sigma-70 family)